MELLTATGALTRYGFACGYIERRASLTLYREHSCYHVKGFNAAGAHRWETCYTLAEARRILRRLAQEGK